MRNFLLKKNPERKTLRVAVCYDDAVLVRGSCFGIIHVFRVVFLRHGQRAHFFLRQPGERIISLGLRRGIGLRFGCGLGGWL